jgi:predicted RNA methylase
VPFLVTPPEIVEQMLRLARVGPTDIVYDLGSGDGRLAIAAVQDFRARAAIGIEIDPAPVAAPASERAGPGSGTA